MRALAGFVMRGREQAVLVAALSTATMLLSWLGAAVVALVTLRKGTRAGLQVLLWALLPAVLITHFMREVGTLAVLLAVMALALLLRSSRYWPAPALPTSSDCCTAARPGPARPRAQPRRRRCRSDGTTARWHSGR